MKPKRGPWRCNAVAIVWPCALSVDAYVAVGREVEVPRPECPGCAASMSFWSGYCRDVRQAGQCRKLFIRRARCRPCARTHALLPAFVLVRRLDVVETIGAVIAMVVLGPGGVRPAAARAGVPYTTAREWLRRFAGRAEALATACAALAVELGAAAMRPARDASRRALEGIVSAFAAASALPGWAALGHWRFASAVCGGRLLATNTNSPYLVIGSRRFMPPVPRSGAEDGGRGGPGP